VQARPSIYFSLALQLKIFERVLGENARQGI
jgi:hypothetical protein